MRGKELILDLTNITKSYSGVTVLRNVDFSLYAGETHCIVGENGAGKSTLIKILSGAITPDYGEIEIFGEKYKYNNPHLPIRLGISTIYQDFDLVETLSVADNIFLGSEMKKTGLVRKKDQVTATAKIFEDLNVQLSPEAIVETLSPAQKQVLQIAKSLKRNAKVLVMDEPTVSLGEEESKMLLSLVKKLSRDGMGIIYISHHLEDVFEIADRITVIKDGSVSGCYEAKKVTETEIISAMVGREASLFYNRERVEIGEECFRVEGLTRAPKVNDISFSVNRGEIFGIGGLVGSGRTELVRLIFGADKKQKGKLYKNGREIQVRNPHEAIANGICMLGEDRKTEAMFLQRSILENVCIVRNEGRVFLNPAEDNRVTNEMIRKLNLKASGKGQEIQRLSGGNQQKSILARWLLSACDVYIFDEPTKGVDIGAREEIYKLMVEIARQGKAVIMVSSDMPELLSMSDRIAVLREGNLVETVSSQDVNEGKLIELYLGIA